MTEPTPCLFCFGLGYTGQRLAQGLAGRGWHVAGTVRSPEKAARLGKAGIDARIIDLRWLSPLPEESLLQAVAGAMRILIVDETRRSGGVAESLMALFAERTDVPVAREVSEDSFIATGPAYAATMPSVESIRAAAKALVAP